MQSYKQFLNESDAWRLYESLKANPVQYSVDRPYQSGDIWVITYKKWSLD